MDLSDLRLFCDLVETGSFSRAAERNFVSQSAVSQRLRALEKEFDQVFLQRSKGKSYIVLTEAGRVLYEGAKPLVGEVAELDNRLRCMQDEISGTVRVATVYSVGLHALPRRLKSFLANHPRVNVHLEYSQTSRVYQDVLSGSVDVGIVAVPIATPSLEIVPFGIETMAVICAPEHRLATRTSVSLRDLEGEPFIAFDDDIPTRRLIDDQLRATGVRVKVVMAFDNIETLKNLVEIGKGIALVPSETVRAEVREGTIVRIPLVQEESFCRTSGIILKETAARRAAVTAFVDTIKMENDTPEAG